MITERQYPMQQLTTLGVGGVAEELLIPESREELVGLLRELKEQNRDYHLLGNGSNIFVASKRITKPVVWISKCLCDFRIGESGWVYAESGVDIRRLINAAVKAGLRAPVELLTVPATVGGAVFMNAGRTSYGVSISQAIESVEVFDGKREFALTKEECQFGHRYSVFHERRDLTILAVHFRYEQESRDRLSQLRRESLQAGADKCYRGTKSAGSVFKRCDWSLMKRLRGIRIGDATLAPNTPNCILNKGKAKPRQIKALIAIAKFAHRLKRKPCELEIEIW